MKPPGMLIKNHELIQFFVVALCCTWLLHCIHPKSIIRSTTLTLTGGPVGAAPTSV